MKTFVRRSAFFALIGPVFSPLAVAHASSPPNDNEHFCQLIDYEQWRRDHPRPAGKRLANLDVGPPRTVRMIYFLPNDRPFRQEVVDSMKVVIRQAQTFYAEQMEAHGYGNRTFRIETDAQGEPLVHRFDGRHSESHYVNLGGGAMIDELGKCLISIITFITSSWTVPHSRAEVEVDIAKTVDMRGLMTIIYGI